MKTSVLTANSLQKKEKAMPKKTILQTIKDELHFRNWTIWMLFFLFFLIGFTIYYLFQIGEKVGKVEMGVDDVIT